MSIRQQRPSLACERLEERLVLSGAPAVPLPSLSPGIADRAAGYTAQAGDQAGNFLTTARDLGRLEGSRHFEDRVDRSDQRDFYWFELAHREKVTIRIDGLAQDVDLYLFDSDGQLQAFSNHTGRQSETIERRLDAGRYSVLVTSYRAAASHYRLTLTAGSNAGRRPDSAGSSFRTARDLGHFDTRLTVRESVGQGDPADVFRFDLEHGSVVRLQLRDLHQDADLYLFDDHGRLLARSVRGGTAREMISGGLGAGTYYVGVLPFGGATSVYELILDRSEPPRNGVPAGDPAPGRRGAVPSPPAAPPAVDQPPAVPATPEPLPDVAYFGDARNWNVNAVGAPEAWARNVTGQGVTVAIVDTGIDLDHADLARNIWRNSGETPGDHIDNDGNGFVDDVFGWNFADRNNNPNDTNGHGTHVAGTIAAARNGFGATGIAYDARLMPIRVLGDRGSGSTLDVAAGIRYAVDNGADIVNLSLGGGFSTAIRTAMQYAMSHDVLLVIAAGNDGRAAPSYPAADSRWLDNVVSVGAYDQRDTIAAFSNRVGASGAVQVDAPGVGVYSTLPGNRYGQLSGTSMATPHVAGVAALVLAARPDLSARDLRSVLVDTADRAVRGSDSIGGVDAAFAVALGLSFDTSSNTAAPAAPTPATTMASSAASMRSLRTVPEAPALPQLDNSLAAAAEQRMRNATPSIHPRDAARQMLFAKLGVRPAEADPIRSRTVSRESHHRQPLPVADHWERTVAAVAAQFDLRAGFLA